MKLDAKLKGGLAWAGLVVVLAVPAADLVIGKQGGSASSVTPVAVETKSASIAAPPTVPVTSEKTSTVAKLEAPIPAAKPKTLTPATDPVTTASVDGKDPVGLYLQKNKKLPDYISDGQTVAATPAETSAAPASSKAQPVTGGNSTEVASVAPESIVPPVPLPRSARPQVASLTPGSEPAPLVLTDKEVAKAQKVEPFPLSDSDSADTAEADDAPIVTGDQLEEWDSGSLADYLASKGLLSDGSSAPVPPKSVKSTNSDYDPDGFYLDQGPNNPDARNNDTIILF